jgi:hypothetical protein
MASNAQLCYNTGSTAGINYNSLPIFQGNIVYANSSDFKTFGCYEITDANQTASTVNAQIIYENCYDCLNENYGVVNFASCDGNYTALQAPISSFGVVVDAFASVSFFDHISCLILIIWILMYLLLFVHSS